MNDIFVELEKRAYQVRRQFSVDADDIFDFSNLLSVYPKITLVKAPFTDDVDGLIFKFDTEKSIIAINCNKTLGDFNFALGHELYHHLFSEKGSAICSFKDFTSKKNKSEESLANFFSMFLLLSFPALEKFINTNCEGIINEQTIVKICNYFRISPRPVIVRLLLLDYISDEQFEYYRNYNFCKLLPLFIDNSAFNIVGGNYSVEGNYIEQASRLFQKGKVTKERFEDLLRFTRLEK